MVNRPVCGLHAAQPGFQLADTGLELLQIDIGNVPQFGIQMFHVCWLSKIWLADGLGPFGILWMITLCGSGDRGFLADLICLLADRIPAW